MRYSICRIAAIIILLGALPLFSAPKKEQTLVAVTTGPETIDRVAAVVNGRPILVSEVDDRIALYKKARSGEKLTDRNRVLDQFINEKLVEQVAEEQAIHVNNARIDNDIKDMMNRSNITDRAVFVKKVENEQGIPFEMFRMQLAKQALMDQVMTYAIDFVPPSSKDAQEWYAKNKGAPDFVQISFKQIVIRPRSDSFEEQKLVSEKLKDIQRRIGAGSSFEDIARRESQDPETARNGGDAGWKLLSDIDPMLAGQFFQEYRPGGIGVFRSAIGYHLVKFTGRRTAPFSELESRIFSMLAFQRRIEQFTKWLDRMRADSEVNIYLEGYVRAKNDAKGAGSLR
ncbi:MAG TPA: peptidylprolyl isomerase [Spirochaetota bacterium]